MTPARGGNKRVFLLTHPRTASNLVIRILNLENQPAVCSPGGNTESSDERGYFFLPTVPRRLELADRRSEDWTEEEHADMKRCLEACTAELVRHVESAEAEGRSVCVKEHLMWMLSPAAEDLVKARVTTEDRDANIPQQETGEGQNESLTKAQNQTVLPDAFLRTWTPTFLIRHPALVFPSLYRTSVDLEGPEQATKNADGSFRMEMTWRWSRNLWEWFNKQRLDQSMASGKVRRRSRNDGQSTSSWPIILDADDVILHPSVIRRYCGIVGLDPDKCQFKWESATAEEQQRLNVFERRMKSSLLSSTGLIKEGKTAIGLDIEREAQKWKAEFGGEEAKKLLSWVKDAMPDYEFLRERRLREGD
ncbi:uncharacterized protein A1O5_01924 [Cladophialophora psammophila CBS 110553]|uniref:Sulfotransferase domain-containing protein n=1 Tax=Cladophialophora psammophila CBS 110553 TaxID=1182543 RepID=W9X4U1_9EURO|nr:uncharacterized protein A1O5_01924 [Cladophialophora psammophila CBS 110553]EXJ75228.1 hypothetical protein A1O5_01924 [Cladophialophora psammophila CBS 110553]